MLNLDKNKNYLLACSFGPDSMALFHMLLSEGYHFSAALVNYHLREESSFEMNGFIDYCHKNNISYHVKDLVGGVTGKNIEAECRKIRYDFFRNLTMKFKYDAVLVAHNKDDVIETYLMQKSRKNLVIFYGINENTTINGTLILRPLLSYNKADLSKYCHDKKVPFAIDSSNFDLRLMRNKIRHQVVGKMSEQDRENILEEIKQKNIELAALFERLNQMDLNKVEVLKGLSDVELAYALNVLIKRVNPAMSLSLKQTLNVRKVMDSIFGNVDIPLKYGYFLRRSYDEIEVVKLGSFSYFYRINEPCEYDCEYFYLNFLGDTSNRNVSIYDYPLTIRNCRPSDKYMIKNYTVSVRRLFIDWKMPLSLRQRWPVIVNKDGNNIYIPRYRKGFKPSKTENFYVK